MDLSGLFNIQTIGALLVLIVVGVAVVIPATSAIVDSTISSMGGGQLVNLTDAELWLGITSVPNQMAHINITDISYMAKATDDTKSNSSLRLVNGTVNHTLSLSSPIVSGTTSNITINSNYCADDSISVSLNGHQLENITDSIATYTVPSSYLSSFNIISYNSSGVNTSG